MRKRRRLTLGPTTERSESSLRQHCSTMTIFEKAAAVYDHPMCNRVLREDLEAHLLHGMVYSNDRCFIMARYVRRDMAPEYIINPWITEPTGLADCLHIYLAAGDISECFTFPHDPVNPLLFSLHVSFL